MDNAIRKIFVFLVGVTLGYCSGFTDAQDHERTVFVRIVQRVQNFAERTVGDRQREIEEKVGEIDPN